MALVRLNHQPSRLNGWTNSRFSDVGFVLSASPGGLATSYEGQLQLKKSLILVQNQLLARITNWSNREGLWEASHALIWSGLGHLLTPGALSLQS